MLVARHEEPSELLDIQVSHILSVGSNEVLARQDFVAH